MESSDYYKQVGARTEYFKGATRTTETYIGGIASLSAVASEHPKGSKYGESDNNIVESSVLETMESDYGKWTVIFSDSKSGEGSDTPIKEQWNMNMTQYEYPLEKYLNEDESSQLRKWKDTDEEHKKTWQYYNGKSLGAGAIYEYLNGKALEVAKKIYAGIENVMKFYPQANRVGLYDSKRTFSSRAEMLNKIDSTPDTQFDDFDVKWLKSAFDWSENSDGTWTLTESWIGAPTWDENLYGDNAWVFYDPTNP